MYVDYGNRRAPAHDLVVSAHAEVYIYPHPPLVRRIVQKSLYKLKVLVSHHRSDTDRKRRRVKTIDSASIF